ncbi:RNB domain-containing ribonuclease [Aestuariimicrobium sp. p3-SID1156]|uniref:RNB domain-containing ribonuclease n=1 Tax=Aestuariimicrobium sp. p3-SID1156 TaxID=2916038 RepID=UPI00223BFFBD|nr:RNB domain-containing ribonuclease [Aestuariimicrobium sp. p3-SID1156]MCT1459553.1 RNB domain-containing ribonuclease [Aestuariimicrobium sp. p3-SID1156]
MPRRHILVEENLPEPIREGFQTLRESLDIPGDFPQEVLAEAERVAAEGYDRSLGHVDKTQIPFVTIDPPSSMDLDQALHISRTEDGGYLVHYAIADVAAWVRPGGAIDQEARRRGQTYYAPHQRHSLHPPALSEAAASLLADGTPRPAQVWQIRLDEDGEIVDSRVDRALVVSTAKLNYADVQHDIDRGTAPESLMLLKQVGGLRKFIELERGGVSLNLPDQEVEAKEDTWELVYRAPLPDEDWNAQISLMTGFCAARMMVEAGVGLLRTLPPPDDGTIKALRRVAHSLQLPWPRKVDYAGFVQSLDPRRPQDQAMMMACVRLFRGARYTVIEPGLTPDQLVHGALAANYAHVTAPLRRLVDRFAGEVCVALCAGTQVPEWVVEALPTLPEIMNESDRRAKAFERGTTDLVEAMALERRVGERFTGVVVSVDKKRPGQGVISLTEPAVEGPVKGSALELGDEVHVELVSVDLRAGKVRFEAR